MTIVQMNLKTGEVTQRHLTEAEIAALTVRTTEEINKEARDKFKADRQALVDSIVVDVGGKLFDGDEVSQTRMARAAMVMTDEETTKWVLANNDDVMVTKAELLAALRLAGAEQTRVWAMP